MKNWMFIDFPPNMLTKLGQRGHAVREDLLDYSTNNFDTDTDSDPDGPSKF
ncbi:hypothetical protein D3OALGA1CA_5217 [Olavius algarvensis associated proteobacterium Delta 3]|nr:hypothetical protein D3OALGB2SA_582 [Olavius algarvensis associated proteobacterium Delta 3]CAB5163583.1 hypothetical protein D3OALGA1CA_5217 [Olavius algarvensis associated proteobacterium Delta 3]